MRKSKFDQSPLPVQDSKYMNQDDNISEIENRVELTPNLSILQIR